ncbi:unnamed protein product [Withania somnifera]
MKQKHINSLQNEIYSMNISNILKSAKIQENIKLISNQLAIDISADRPSASWNRKKHIVTLPYEENFCEDDIPIKSRPRQMNTKLVEFCKNEIDNLLQKGLIKPSKSPWSCTTFYVNNTVKKSIQIQIFKEHTYRIAFNVPFEQYEWNVMPFGLKNAPSNFKKL